MSIKGLIKKLSLRFRKSLNDPDKILVDNGNSLIKCSIVYSNYNELSGNNSLCVLKISVQDKDKDNFKTAYTQLLSIVINSKNISSGKIVVNETNDGIFIIGTLKSYEDLVYYSYTNEFENILISMIMNEMLRFPYIYFDRIISISKYEKSMFDTSYKNELPDNEVYFFDTNCGDKITIFSYNNIDDSEVIVFTIPKSLYEYDDIINYSNEILGYGILDIYSIKYNGIEYNCIIVTLQAIANMYKNELEIENRFIEELNCNILQYDKLSSKISKYINRENESQIYDGIDEVID